MTYEAIRRTCRENHEEKLGGIKDNALTEAEERLRRFLVEQSKAILIDLFEHITDENAPRALRLIEQTAETQRSLLSSVMLGGEGPKPTMPDYSTGIPELYGSPSGMDVETYGAAAIEQVASAVSRAAAPSNESRLQNLLSALRLAQDTDETEVIAHLKDRIAALISSTEACACDLPTEEASEKHSEEVGLKFSGTERCLGRYGLNE